MPKTFHPYGLKVNLNVEDMAVEVESFRRGEGDEENEVIGTQSFHVGDLHADTRPRNDLYGLSKILQDRTSAESKTPNRLTAMTEVFQRLCEGQWEKEREAGGPSIRVEVEALAILNNVSPAIIQRELRRYEPAAREKMLSHPAVVAKAKELAAEREDGESPDLSSFLEGAEAAE